VLREAVYALVDRHGGSFSAEHGLGPANVAWWTAHEQPAALATLAAVKRVLDPYGLLGTEALRDALTDDRRDTT
jgi:FAD/FMN-containing dehydrogenase